MAHRAARAAIRARIDGYYANGDIDGLFSGEADRDAAALSTGADRSLVAELMWCRYLASGDPEHLAVAIDLADQVAATDPRLRPEVLDIALDTLDDPQTLPDLDDAQREIWAGLFYDMTVALSAGAFDDLARLNRIINGLALVLELTPQGHPERRRAVVLDARYRSERAKLTGNHADAEAAAATMGEVLAGTTADDPDLPLLRQFHAGALLFVYDLTGTMESRVALAEALLESADDEWSAALGAVIAQREPDAGPVTTEQALTLGRLGVAVHPVGDPGRPGALFALGAALSQRAGDRQSIPDNTEAVAAVREMLDLLGPFDDGSEDANVRRGECDDVPRPVLEPALRADQRRGRDPGGPRRNPHGA
jgi:hypothetical protein